MHVLNLSFIKYLTKVTSYNVFVCDMQAYCVLLGWILQSLRF